ncbi:UDP-2,4-diacetamido-2,4,6-trideoxy-beta-L-altropyranose hydrolase [Formivibrio citricus]|uniref:UDP-2,4-diacetamido-2,4,6-trideoxy-beta-L-altropyranose hydrolase n=1 Tax=Formivibrio citricus TaxID=83765 RepID=A0A1I4VAY8_9NEIS|nr:UDP-2,4-diacetamido-2,4,6-trideoxy-beta-L-altropyranose hydrolase [Formivibrio citricus]SFM98371.1 UDP-2,4-diacetamido-2,4,6-trideoxy-beta-L-altropyranose hydrolase [Formivibrio citricus]
MRVAIRADASAKIGSGHVMRCLTLADELAGRGAQIIFLTQDTIGALADRICLRGHECLLLPDNTPESTARRLAAIRPDWLIIDHYGCDADWEACQRPYAGRILVIDDQADRKHDCDGLLDQNLHHDPAARYQSLVSPLCHMLLGPSYALLAERFVQFRMQRNPSGAVQNVLVSFGGSDPTGETLKLLPEFVLALPDLHWHAVVGGLCPQLAEIRRLGETHAALTVHADIDYMPELMQTCDLFVGAGGATTWERACLGLPSIVAAVSDNQEALSDSFARTGAQIYLGRASGLQAEQWIHAIRMLCQDDAMRSCLCAKSMACVDGYGVRRVADFLMEGCA